MSGGVISRMFGRGATSRLPEQRDRTERNGWIGKKRRRRDPLQEGVAVEPIASDRFDTMPWWLSLVVGAVGLFLRTHAASLGDLRDRALIVCLVALGLVADYVQDPLRRSLAGSLAYTLGWWALCIVYDGPIIVLAVLLVYGSIMIGGRYLFRRLPIIGPRVIALEQRRLRNMSRASFSALRKSIGLPAGTVEIGKPRITETGVQRSFQLPDRPGRLQVATMVDALARHARRAGARARVFHDDEDNPEGDHSIVHIEVTDRSAFDRLDAGERFTEPAPRNGRIWIGYTAGASDFAMLKRPGENNHALIGGASGFGKSYLMRRIARADIEHGDDVRLIDLHGDFDHDDILIRVPDHYASTGAAGVTMMLELQDELERRKRIPKRERGALSVIDLHVDEWASMARHKGIPDVLAVLAEEGRKFSINLRVGTQSPKAGMFGDRGGGVRGQFAWRFGLHTADMTESNAVLGNGRAGKGADCSKLTRPGEMFVVFPGLRGAGLHLMGYEERSIVALGYTERLPAGYRTACVVCGETNDDGMPCDDHWPATWPPRPSAVHQVPASAPVVDETPQAAPIEVLTPELVSGPHLRPIHDDAHRVLDLMRERGGTISTRQVVDAFAGDPVPLTRHKAHAALTSLVAANVVERAGQAGYRLKENTR